MYLYYLPSTKEKVITTVKPTKETDIGRIKAFRKEPELELTYEYMNEDIIEDKLMENSDNVNQLKAQEASDNFRRKGKVN